MQKVKFTSVFLVLLALSIIIFLAAKINLLNGIGPILLSPFTFLRGEIYREYIDTIGFRTSDSSDKLKEENQNLRSKLVDLTKTKQDNVALRDQFQTTKISSVTLLPAKVVGAPSFIPGVSLPESLILDKGLADGVKAGNAVIFKDNLVGRITSISKNLSTVTLVSNPSTSFTAKTGDEGKTFGVVKGQGGGEIILDNVLLSETLKNGNLVLTKGDVDSNGQGLPPDLIVGKITSIDKNPSALFQKANIQSFLNFSKLTTVFVIK